MGLTFDKLLNFDLMDSIDAKILDKENVEIFMEFHEVCQQIQTVDQFIRDCPAYPGSMEGIKRSEFVSSIGATLAIEGTRLSTEEIEAALKKTDVEAALKKSDQESQNTEFAYHYVQDLVANVQQDKFIYQEEYIKEIHKRLTSNIDYGLNVPGKYRDVNPIYGEPPRRSLCRTKGEVQIAMKKFTEWLNREGEGYVSNNRFARAIVAHYYLVEIHPFGDGNGRTARALEALILLVGRINTYCFWALANFWSANRTEYITRLGNIRATCDIWEFLIWGLKGYLGEVERIKGKVLKKAKQLMLMDYVRWLNITKKRHKPEKKINKRIEGILELLTQLDEIPLAKFMSLPQMRTLYHKLSDQTRYRDFEKMFRLGLIRTYEKDKEKHIGPNYQLLEYLEYRVRDDN